MTSPSGSEPRTRSLYHALSPVQAAGLVAIAIASLYLLEIVLGAAGLGLGGVAIAYIVVAAGIVAFARGDVAAVGLAPARARHVIAGALVGMAMWYVGLQLVEWLRPPGDLQVVEQALEHTALPPGLIVIAVLPAITEELIFRGVLARSLATRLPVAAAVVVSALVFSAFHLVPRQMVAVFPLGLALGYLAIRARSIVPTMLAHLVNNTIVMLAMRGELDALDRVPQAALLAAALVVIAGGLALAATGPA